MNSRLGIFLFSGVVLAACGRVPVSMVSSTAVDQSHPFAAVEGGEWRALDRAEFVKLHIYPDEPIKVQEVSVETCGAPFDADAHVFINFDEKSAPLVRSSDKKSLKGKFDATVTARSVTINFGENHGLCIRNLSVGNVRFKTPRVVDGDVSVSMHAGEAYDPMNLFDSRYEYAWAAMPQDRNVWIQISLKEAIHVTALKIWNGYQRSDIHCVWNGRPKEVLVSGDGGYSEKILLQDVMGAQVVPLPHAYTGKNIRLSVVSAYPGKKWPEVAISELRFLDGSDVITVNPIKRMGQIVAGNTSRFREAALQGILDRGLEGGFDPSMTENGGTSGAGIAWVAAEGGLKLRAEPSSEGKQITLIPDRSTVEVIERQSEQAELGGKKGRWAKVRFSDDTGWAFDAYLSDVDPSSETNRDDNARWSVRLRSDGSAFLEGSAQKVAFQSNEGPSQRFRRFFALGNYKILGTTSDSVDVELFGLLRVQTETMAFMGGDCNGCGRDCNKLGQGPDGSTGEIFSDRLRLSRQADGTVLITNLNPEPKLGFRRLYMKEPTVKL